MRALLIGGFACLIATPVFAGMTYSSIALSEKTGAWGRAYDWPSREQADSTAMDYCRKYSSQPDDCKVVTWSQGEYCAAVAVKHHTDGGVTWGSASGATMDAARSLAFETCDRYNDGQACDEILTEVCSHNN